METLIKVPDPMFAWGFAVLVLAVAGVACYFDMRHWRIPNRLTVTALALGLVIHIVRGVWLGLDGLEAWKLGASEASGTFLAGLVGGLDGFLFSLAGFGAGFGLFFIMWFLRFCGGGDVKLFAAMGAWLGPLGVVFLLVATIFAILILLVLHYVVLRTFWGDQGMIFKKLDPAYMLTDEERRKYEKQQKAGNAPKKKPRLFLAYSPALVLAVAMVLGWWIYRSQYQPRENGSQMVVRGTLLVVR